MTAAATGAVVSLVEIAGPLALFVEAMAGRRIELVAHADARANGRFWPAELAKDSKPAFEQERIHLPPSIDLFSSKALNRRAYRFAALHQIGYLELAGAPIAFPPAPRPELWWQILGLLEDLRIDAQVRRLYPGAVADMQNVLLLSRAEHLAVDSAGPLQSRMRTLALFSLGASAASLYTPTEADMKQLLAEAQTLQRASARFEECAPIATRICAHLTRFGELSTGGSEASSAPRPAPQATKTLSPGSTKGGMAALHSRSSRKSVRANTGNWQDQDSDSLPADHSEADQSEHDVDAQGRTATSAPQNAAPAEFLYQEWDYLSGSYLPAWCRLHEEQLRGEDTTFIQTVRQDHAILARQIRRQFRQMKPQHWIRVQRSIDGDEIDLDGLIETLIDQRQGHYADTGFYTRRDRARRDVATAFLLDMSASTGVAVAGTEKQAPAPQEDPGPYLHGGFYAADFVAPTVKSRRMIDVAKESLALMSEALSGMGDLHAIYGFSGEGRMQVEFKIAKEFNQRASARSWSALAAMQPRRSTRMGPAIRHTVSKLLRQPARSRLLIVISDGYPQDIDYGPPGDEEYGIQDTARALLEAQRAGVSAFCITIDPSGNDYLRRMCAPRRYLVMDDVKELPRELTKVYRELRQA